MTEIIKQRAFEHLFTTKPIGQGTGLGLAIVYQIIVEKHHGTIDIHLHLDKGLNLSLRCRLKVSLFANRIVKMCNYRRIF